MVDRELEQARVQALETLRAPWPKPERRTRTRAPAQDRGVAERVPARRRGGSRMSEVTVPGVPDPSRVRGQDLVGMRRGPSGDATVDAARSRRRRDPSARPGSAVSRDPMPTASFYDNIFLVAIEEPCTGRNQAGTAPAKLNRVLGAVFKAASPMTSRSGR